MNVYDDDNDDDDNDDVREIIDALDYATKFCHSKRELPYVTTIRATGYD
jgi:hypothetical protein